MDCIHIQFDRAVEKYGSRTAVITDDQSYTYVQLASMADRIAASLISSGIQSGDRVGLYMGRSAEFIVSMLGVLKAGGCCVPVDVDYSEQRARQIIGAADLSFLILTDEPSPEIFNISAEIIEYDDAAACTSHFIPPLYSQSDPAFVFFTSGSTGTPKGVIMNHDNRIASIRWLIADLESCARHLFKSSVTHNPMVREVFWPLLTGGVTVVVPKGAHRDLDVVKDLIYRHEIQSVGFTPSMLRMFVRSVKLGATTFLKHVICGGETIDGQTIQMFHRKFPGTRLLRFYGLTEAGMVLYLECKNDSDPTSLGFPTYATVRLLDEQMVPVDKGQQGEIFISGKGIASGYLNDTQRTDAKFIDDPYLLGAKMFATGDRALRTKSGEFLYLGRADRLVKIRGIRVELGEIETLVNKLPFVDTSIAFLLAADKGDKLVCIYVPAGTALKPPQVDVTRLRLLLPSQDHLRDLRSLPCAAVPHHFFEVSSLPMLPNGKVDLATLREGAAEVTTRKPTGEREHSSVRAIAAHVFNTSVRSGRDRIFSDLGADSLKIIEFIIEIHSAVGVELSTEEIYPDRTIAEIESAIQVGESEVDDTHDLPRLDISTLEPSTELPLSVQQSLAAAAVANNLHLAATISGGFEFDTLLEALICVVSGNPILRARLSSHPGHYTQTLSSNISDLVEYIRMRGTSEECRAAAYLAARRHAYVATSKNRTLSILVIWIGAREFLISFSFHAAFFDGTSIRIFLRELSTAYLDQKTEETVRQPVKRRCYLDYVFWEQETYTLKTRDHAVKIEEVAAKLSAPGTTTKGPDRRSMPPLINERSVTILPEDAARIRSIAQISNMSASRMLIGLVALWRSRHLAQTEVVLDVMSANRNLAATQTMIGPLAVRVPLFFSFDGCCPSAIIEAIRAGSDLLHKQHPPFALVQDAIGFEQLPRRRVLISEFTDSLNAFNLPSCKCNRLILPDERTDKNPGLDLVSELSIRYVFTSENLTLKFTFDDAISSAVSAFESFIAEVMLEWRLALDE